MWLVGVESGMAIPDNETGTWWDPSSTSRWRAACREDAHKVFRRYWEYTLPIREFMAATSEEAVQVLFQATPVHIHDGLKDGLRFCQAHLYNSS